MMKAGQRIDSDRGYCVMTGQGGALEERDS